MVRSECRDRVSTGDQEWISLEARDDDAVINGLTWAFFMEQRVLVGT